MESAGEHDVVGMVRVVQHELSQRPEVRFDRVRPRAVGRRETQLDLVACRPSSDLDALVGRQVVEDHIDPVAVGSRGSDRFATRRARWRRTSGDGRHPTACRRRSSSSRGTAGPRAACGSSPADAAARIAAPSSCHRPGGCSTARTHRTRNTGPARRSSPVRSDRAWRHGQDRWTPSTSSCAGTSPDVLARIWRQPLPADLHDPLVVVGQIVDEFADRPASEGLPERFGASRGRRDDEGLIVSRDLAGTATRPLRVQRSPSPSR